MSGEIIHVAVNTFPITPDIRIILDRNEVSPMEKIVVVALGHRALGTTLPEQKVATKAAAKGILLKERVQG